MPSPADQAPPRVFSLKLTALLLAASIGASWLLVPRQDELVERLFKDKQYERIAETLRRSLAESGSSETLNMRNLSADQLNTLIALLRLTPREQLRAIFSSSRPPHYDTYIHGLALGAIRYVNVISPADAWAMIQPRLEGIEARRQLDICELLSKNALASEQPALAAEILTHACGLPPAPWTMARDTALAHRWSGQPGRGAAILKTRIADHRGKIPASGLASLQELGRETALESGQPGLALDFFLDASSSLPDEIATSDGHVQQALSIALQAGRAASILPLLRKKLASMPEWILPLGELRESRRRQPASPAMASFKKWCGQMADICDWSDLADEAFSCHLKLAALGELASLDQCLDLSDYLGRDEETAGLLKMLHPIPEREAAEIALARMLAGLGEDQAARPLFESWIARHPRDRDAAFDLAMLVEDMGDEAGARVAFAEVVKKFPGDVPARKKLAEALIRDGMNREALALYSEFAESMHDPQTLESYAMLAESLDDYEQLVAALRLRARLAAKPDVQTYLDLADAASHLRDPQAAIAVIEQGIERMPGSSVLRVALASTLIHTGEADRVIDVLASGPSLRSNPDALALALSIAAQCRDPEKVLAFVGTDVDKRITLPLPSLLDLAVLCELCGEGGKAARLFQSVPEAVENLPLLAEARHETGEHEEAIRLMNSYLALNPRAAASDWVFLGELYDLIGRSDDARRAYDNSLAILTADLPGTAFIPSASGAEQKP